MVNSIWAIFNHMISDSTVPLEQQHSRCPKSDDTWCKFWSDRDAYTKSNRLAEVFRKELKPIFTFLTNDELLKRCLKGHTQNQNESLNRVLWSKCLKTKFSGRRKVLFAACETTSIFNTGASSKLLILRKMGIKSGVNTFKACEKEDQERIKNATHKISITTRRYRRKRRAEKKAI